ncbi:MAG: hypothetical protein AAFP76_14785, partial [Bacteroidota bacterium]
RSKGYTEVEWTYFKQMMTAAKALDACSKKPNHCSLKDPVTNKKASAIQQIEKGFSFGVEREMKVQKKVATFEKAISENKKNKVLPWIVIQSAFSKHSGYSYEAMSSRFKIYIKSMERVFEDE